MQHAHQDDRRRRGGGATSPERVSPWRRNSSPARTSRTGASPRRTSRRRSVTSSTDPVNRDRRGPSDHRVPAGPPGSPGQGAVATYQNPEWAQVDRNTIGSPVAALRAGPYSGPVQPPFGVGSLGFTVGETEKASFGNEVDFIGDDVSALSQVGFRVFTTQENRVGGTTRQSQHAGHRVRVRPQRCGRDDDELLLAHLESGGQHRPERMVGVHRRHLEGPLGPNR